MKTQRIICVTAAFFLLLASMPVVNASAAHPHGHSYAGTSVNNIYVDWNLHPGSPPVIQEKGKFNFDVNVVGTCTNVVPLFSVGIPPEDLRDDDSETAYGGTCFAFATTYGDDTGSSPLILLTDGHVTEVVYLACVDVNGDGLCIADSTDEVNLCWTGANSNSGAESLSNPGGACTVYENPAAADPTIHVFVLGAVDSDTSRYGETVIDTTVGVRGSIYLF